MNQDNILSINVEGHTMSVSLQNTSSFHMAHSTEISPAFSILFLAFDPLNKGNIDKSNHTRHRHKHEQNSPSLSAIAFLKYHSNGIHNV
jgi:hypothetical protein